MAKECVHCHSCLERDVERVVFCMAECQRLYCRPCIENNRGLCLSCQTPRCRTVQLITSAPEDVRMAFKDTGSWLRSLVKVQAFQHSQQMNLIRGQDKKIKALLSENSELKRRVDHLHTECQSLRQEVRQLKIERHNRFGEQNSKSAQNTQNRQNSGIMGRKSDWRSTTHFAGLRNESRVESTKFRSFLQSAETPHSTRDTDRLFGADPNQSVISGISAMSNRSSIKHRFDTLMSKYREKGQLVDHPMANDLTPMSVNTRQTPITLMSNNTPMSARTTTSRESYERKNLFTQTPHSLHLFTPSQTDRPTNKVVHKVNPFNR